MQNPQDNIYAYMPVENLGIENRISVICTARIEVVLDPECSRPLCYTRIRHQTVSLTMRRTRNKFTWSSVPAEDSPSNSRSSDHRSDSQKCHGSFLG